MTAAVLTVLAVVGSAFHGYLWSREQRYLAVLEEYRKELAAVRKEREATSGAN